MIILKEFKKIEICSGVDLVCVDTDRFKTNEISITFSVPLDEKTASSNALLLGLITRTTKAYPTPALFNQKLSMLYGAGVAGVVSKYGENQGLTLAVSSLDDRFALDNESISADSFELLMSLIFAPNVDENGCFSDDDIAREKRVLIEKLEGEINEKRVYSLRQLEKNMFKNEPYSINRYGTVDNIKAVTNDDLKASLEYIKSNAKIQITAVGTVNTEMVEKIARSYFSAVERDYISPKASVFVPVAEKVNTVTERIDVKQGKLVLGFRVNDQSDFVPNSAMRSFCDVFGGGPYSKLFLNVREKLSLCYYCSARYDRRKSNIIIQCGCEEENMDKAVEEILNQLEEIKKGNFDTELEASKIGLCDVINGVNDDSISLANWYSSQINDYELVSPSMSAEHNNSVTKADVQACAELLSLDTIYKLCKAEEVE